MGDGVCVCVCLIKSSECVYKEVSHLGDNEGNVIVRFCVCRVVLIQHVLGKLSPLFLHLSISESKGHQL